MQEPPEDTNRAARDAGPRSWAPYVELLRLHLSPSAMADSQAGLVVGAWGSATAPTATDMAWAATASLLAYWFGMVTNDIFDRGKDRTLFPERPLPSGRVGTRSAVALAAALAAGALAVGTLSGTLGIVAAVLACALAYNVGGKRLPFLGNLLMGLCRGGNFVLGAAVALGASRSLDQPAVCFGAGILALYVYGVTSVSELEERAAPLQTVLARGFLVFLLPLLPAATRQGEPLVWAHAALQFLLLLEALRPRPGAPPVAARLVGRALSLIPLLDAGIVLALRPAGATVLGPVCVLYALFILGLLWRHVRFGASRPSS